MVFSSIPAYNDPSNWQQQQQQNNSQFLPPPQTLPPPSQPHGAGGSGSIRPGSMADRARMANIPLPEPAQKCPRCESTNTKFCYFNNYSLTQPRHFCKTCRRYWTRGGALRNVPVGGGCRRNKRSKGTSSSKSPASNSSSTSTSTGSLPSNTTSAHQPPPPDAIGFMTNQVPSLRLMPPLHPHHHHLTDFSDMGLNYGLNYAAMGSGGGGDHEGNMDQYYQWRLQQFPFMAAGGFDPSPPPPPLPQTGLFDEAASSYLRPRTAGFSANQLANSVKMEDHHHHHHRNDDDNTAEMNLSRQLLGLNNENQYWSSSVGNANAWTDLSGFNSSSTAGNQP